MSKKIGLITLILALCLGVAAALPVLAADTARDFNDLVYVNGVDTQSIEIKPENAAARAGRYTAGEGTVELSYDETAGTVTVAMTNAAIQRPLKITGLNAVVELAGDNSLTGLDLEYGLEVQGGLTIKGTDKAADRLTINGKGNAVWVKEALTVRDAYIAANMNRSAAPAEMNYFVINVNENISVYDSKLELVGTGDWDSIGMYSDRGNIRIENSIVEADGISSRVIEANNTFGGNINGAIDIVDSLIFQSSEENACGTVLSGAGSVVIDNSSIEFFNCSRMVICAGQSAPADIIIKNNSEVAFSNTGADTAAEGCFATGDLIIQNSELLGRAGLQALYAMGDVIIDGSPIRVESTESAGILSNGNLAIINGAEVNSEGVRLGVFMTSGSTDKGNISVRDSSLVASGKSGIYTYSGDISIEGADAFVYGYNNGVDEAGRNYYAIAAPEGNINISGGKAGAISGDSCAMFAKNVTVSGSDTLVAVSAASGQNAGLSVQEQFTVNGGIIAVASDNNKGLAAGDIVINDGDLTVISRDCGIYVPTGSFKVEGGRLELLTLADDAIKVQELALNGGSFLVKIPSGKQPLLVGSAPDFSADDLTGIAFEVKVLADDGSNLAGCLVTLYPENGEPPQNYTVISGEKLVAPAAPQKPGYSFKGWYKSSSAEAEQWDFANDIVTRHLALYAQYSRNSGGGGGGSRYYSLSFVTNGGNALSMVQAKAGEVISLADYVPVRPGYSFDGWYADKELTERIGEISLHANKTVYAAWREQTAETEGPGLAFADVKETDWFYKDVAFVYEKGLMQGEAAERFNPGGSLTRAMLVTILYRLEQEPAVSPGSQFSDVPASQWYSQAVSWAAESGIIKGYANGDAEAVFRPLGEISREEMAVMLGRYAELKGLDVSAAGDISGYADAEQTAAWARVELGWANTVGLIRGDESRRLNPQAKATRAETAAILQRLFQEVL